MPGRPAANAARPAASRGTTHLPTPSWTSILSRLGRRAALPLALYLIAAALLTVQIGNHPGFSYNWEDYTAWRVFTTWRGPTASPRAVFALTDGLMTDSGQGPLVGLPVWLGFALGGVGLTPLRLPVALVASTAVPLLWLVGRRLAGPWVEALAAVLLALSPVYLLYGRTATLVGISLVPALLTVYALLRVLTGSLPRSRLAWLIVLQVCLVTGAYSYAPVRLLWPLSVALLAIATWRRPASRRSLLAALLLTASTLPVALALIDAATAPTPDPWGAVAHYFDARGEQILALRDTPGAYWYFLRPTAAEAAAGELQGSPSQLAYRLVAQNSGHLARLLLDRETLPTLTDHWNAHGRLYPALLVPFFAHGLAATIWGALARRRMEDLTLLFLTGGLTLPLLLTSRVHVGRLLPALPFLFLIVATGWSLPVRWLAAQLTRRDDSRRTVWARLTPLALTAILLLAVSQSTWADYRHPPPPSPEKLIADDLVALSDAAPARGGVALVVDPALGPEIESVETAALRLTLDDRYRFVDLAHPPPTSLISPSDRRPPLYTGGPLNHLSLAGLPNACDTLYLVAPTVAARFLAALGPSAAPTGCPAPLRYRVLPR